jgi:ABC-2 type transport system permease protein
MSKNFSSATLVKLEIIRTLRNRKFMFFSVIYPTVLYLIISGTGKKGAVLPGSHLTMQLYYLVAMASFGAMTAVLMGNSERIAKERENGWVRQLRLTALPGHGYVVAKIASAATITLPAILVVEIVAAVGKGVHLQAWQWGALTLSVWAGSLVFAALGVAIGYVASGDAVRPITMIIYFAMALLGGLWMPSTVFPQWLQDFANWLPTHAYAGLGQAIELGNAPHQKDVALLAAYLVVFAGLAAWLYRRDTKKG